VENRVFQTKPPSPGKVVSREDLSQSVLGRPFDPFDRSLDMHVSRLRRKLSSTGAEESLVKTIRGVGYQLVLDRDAVEAGN
jgi:DNA-binding response OmpR family regulator